MASRRKARIYAMQALFSWDVTSASVEDLCRLSWVEATPGREDTFAYARLLIGGTIENHAEIDRLISDNLSHWTLERLGQVDRAILRLSTFSLLHQEDLSGRIIIDEAIGLAKEFGTDESYRFVNGVLDAINKSVRASGPSS